MNADVYEIGDKFVVVAEVPGFSEKEINISLAKRFLTIESMTPKEKNHDAIYRLQERNWGFFKRTFMVPDGFNDSFSTSHNNGLVSICVERKKI